MSRSTIFGSPFKNLNSGRDETSDTENTTRITQSLNNYLKSEQGLEDAKSFEQPFVSKERAQITKYLAPLTGGLIGKFTADAFTSPRAIYLSKFIILGFVMCGYKYSIDVQNSHQTGFVLRNYQRFPIEIQKSLKSHDARYSRKWLIQ